MAQLKQKMLRKEYVSVHNALKYLAQRYGAKAITIDEVRNIVTGAIQKRGVSLSRTVAQIRAET